MVLQNCNATSKSIIQELFQLNIHIFIVTTDVSETYRKNWMSSFKLWLEHCLWISAISIIYQDGVLHAGNLILDFATKGNSLVLLFKCFIHYIDTLIASGIPRYLKACLRPLPYLEDRMSRLSASEILCFGHSSFRRSVETYEFTELH